MLNDIIELFKEFNHDFSAMMEAITGADNISLIGIGLIIIVFIILFFS